jgi:hypothetical protein
MKDEAISRPCWLLRFLLLASLLAACRTDPPELPKFDKTGHLDTLFVPDWPASCQSAAKLAPPALDLFPNPTTYVLQAFRGRCPGADMVSARAGGVSSAPVKAGTDGSFCIEVQLLADSPNTVVFQGIDPNGCPGQETQISITHRTGTKPADGGILVPTNLAKAADIGSDPKPEQGELSMVVDGDYGSYVKLSCSHTWTPWGDCGGDPVWVRVDLGKVYTITKAKAVWAAAAGNDFAKRFAFLLSSEAGPGDPSTTSGAWKVVKEESSNGESKETLIALSPEPARWAALLMYEDNSGGLHLSETFQLAELEVWGQDPNAVPPPPPDRCK